MFCSNSWWGFVVVVVVTVGYIKCCFSIKSVTWEVKIGYNSEIYCTNLGAYAPSENAIILLE